MFIPIKVPFIFVSIIVVSSLLSSCTLLMTRQEADIHMKLDHNIVEVKRGERILQLVDEGNIKADPIIRKFIEQRDTIIRNNTEAIRLHINGESEE